MLPCLISSFFFFFNDTATTEIYTLSLHDALPICGRLTGTRVAVINLRRIFPAISGHCRSRRSEEHTSELQSPDHLVCRLLLEKKKKNKRSNIRKLSITRLAYCRISTSSIHDKPT